MSCTELPPPPEMAPTPSKTRPPVAPSMVIAVIRTYVLPLAARTRTIAGKCAGLSPVANPTGEIGQLRDEALPAVRVIVLPDRSGRVFEDDLDPGDVVFDGKLTPMLVWHERYPVGRGWRSGWVLRFDTDGQGNRDDYIVG